MSDNPESPTHQIPRQTALELDRNDPLARFRDAFAIEDPDLVYLDGNSLGRLPKRTRSHLHDVIDQGWGRDLIGSWGENWFEAPVRIGDAIAPLIGAEANQVVVADSTSVNLFKLAMAALELQAPRTKIVSDEMNFPSDLYVLQGAARLRGRETTLELVPPSADGIHADETRLLEAIDGDAALVVLSHVTFKSGYMFDSAAITARAHEVGALVLWDLSHSAGSAIVELDAWNADLAIGCTYKYLNGGPGAPAFLFVRNDLQDELLSPIWGWFGQTAPFGFDLAYDPVAGIRRFLVGTPPVLSMLGIEEGVAVLREAGMPAVRRKSEALTTYLIDLIDEVLVPMGFSVGTPRDPARRGSHVTIRHRDAYRISRAMLDAKIVPDFREPDNVRLGVSPLYTTFVELHDAVERIRDIVANERYEAYSKDRGTIT